MNDQQRLHTMVADLARLAKKLGRTPSLKEFEASGHSKRQIIKFKYSELCKLAGIEPNRRAQDIDPVQVTTSPPKILIFDLEVSTKVVHTYQMWDTSIPAERVIKDFYILAFSAKYFGEEKIYYHDTRNSPGDDTKILEKLSKLINDATHLCGHNLKKFDLPTLRARMIQKEIQPIPDIPVLDTMLMCKKLFKFTSNKLSEVAKYLKADVLKDDHGEFPGISLFTEAMNGNIKAFKAMEHYCKTDSIVCEKILEKLMPWDQSINFQSNYEYAICSCGSSKFFKNGIKYLKQAARQMYKCSSCGKNFVSKHNLISKLKTKDFMA